MDQIKNAVKSVWTLISDKSQSDSQEQPPQSPALPPSRTCSPRKRAGPPIEHVADVYPRLPPERFFMERLDSSTVRQRINPLDEDSPRSRRHHLNNIEEIHDSESEHDEPSQLNPLASSLRDSQKRSTSQEDRLLPPDRSFRKDPDAVIIPDPMVQKKPQPACVRLPKPRAVNITDAPQFSKAALPNHGPKPLNTLRGPSGVNRLTRSGYLIQHLGREPGDQPCEGPPRKKIKTGTSTDVNQLRSKLRSGSPTPAKQKSRTDTNDASRVESNSKSPRKPSRHPTQEVLIANTTLQAPKKHGDTKGAAISETTSLHLADEVQSPYLTKLNGTDTTTRQPRADGQTRNTLEPMTSSDSDEDSKSLRDSRSKRKAEKSSARPFRPDTVRGPSPGAAPVQSSRASQPPRSKELQAPALPEAISAPPESPDELQVDGEAYSRMQPSSKSVLMSPVTRIGPKQRGSKGLGHLIQGISNSTKLRPDDANLNAKSPQGSIHLTLKRIASARLRPIRTGYYIFVIDTAEKLVWINIRNTSFSNQPVMGPFKVAQLLEIAHSTGVQPLVLIRLRPDHTHDGGRELKMVLELETVKGAVDLVRELQQLDPDLKIRDKSDQWLQKLFDLEEKAAGNASHSTSEHSADELAPSSRMPVQSDKPLSRQKRPGKRVNTRGALDLGKTEKFDPLEKPKPPTVITGSDRRSQSGLNASRSESPLQEISRVHTMKPRLDDRNEQAQQQTHAVTRSGRQTRVAAKRSPSPEKLKFSATGGLGLPWTTPLVYPPEGKKQASVEFGSLRRLDDGELLNDTIISFFIRYLQDQTERNHPEYLKKMHFFNTYFLENLRKGGKRTGINYESVKTWTKNIDLFSRDFVVIPVNESVHWYVIIVCNLQWFKQASQAEDDQDVVEVFGSADEADGIDDNRATTETQRSFGHLSIEDSGLAAAQSSGRFSRKKKQPPLKKYDNQRPIIISLDSLGMPRSPTCGLVKQYIIEEAKSKIGIEIEKEELPAMTAKLIPLQNNYSDCGLYVCMYLEQFIKQPYRFVEAVLQREANFGWPENVCGSDLRKRMRNLILELHREQEREEGQQEIPEIGNILVQMQGPKVEMVPDSSPAEEADEPEGQPQRSDRTASPGRQDIYTGPKQPSRPGTPPSRRPYTKIDTPKSVEEVSQLGMIANVPVVRKRPLKGGQPSYRPPERVVIPDDDDKDCTTSPSRKRQRLHLSADSSKSLQDSAESPHRADREANQTTREDSVTTDYLQGNGEFGNRQSQEVEGLPAWAPSPDAHIHDIGDRSQKSAEIPETELEDEVPQRELRADGRAGDDEIIFP